MQIPLFPLHTVLAPGIALPLHVFEDRYRVMVRRCLDASAPFGVVLIRGGSEVASRSGAAQELAIAGVGTFAEIREASRLDDGRWDLLVVGGGRFVVRTVHAGIEPYLVADVEPVPDAPGDRDRAETLVERVTRRFVDYLRLLQPRDGEVVEPIDVQLEVDVDDEEDPDDDDADETDQTDDEADDADETDGTDDEVRDDVSELVAALRIPDDPSTLSFLLAGIVQVEPDRKQALLEAASAEERLGQLDELLDRELILLSRRLAPYALDRSLLAAREN